MNTAHFIDLISAHPDKLLRFKDHTDELVHPSYHVSEVKTAIYQTVDCGNADHTWKETILQLWLSDDPDAERAMQISKVLKIMDLVSPRIAVDPGAEVMIEYGNENFPPIVFHVGFVQVEEREVTVTLQVPTTQCKLELRGSSCAKAETVKENTSSCCEDSSSKCC